MKPKILAILPGLIPSTVINVTTPLIDLHKAHLINARVTLEMFVNERIIEWSDLIIFCRNVESAGARWLSKILQSQKPFIYDIDDNFFELPLETPLEKYYRSHERIAMLEEYLCFASLVRVYSEPMLQRAKSLNLSTVKVNGYVNWRYVNTDTPVEENQRVKIVYATSRVDDKLAEIFKPALKKILEKYGKQIEVFFLGYNPPEFKSYPNVFFWPLNLNYEKYLRNFSGARFDIGLAPLYDDIFHRSKTNLKVREYGACHIAGIYSDVDTYSASIIHNKNGLLVKNSTEAWYSAMSILIGNQELRKQIQEQAFKYAQEHFSQEAFTQVWYRQISQILNNSPVEIKQDCSVEHQVFAQKKNVSFPENDSLTDLGADFWLRNALMRLVVGVKADGVSFLVLNIRMKVQLFWNLLKIKFTLFFH